MATRQKYDKKRAIFWQNAVKAPNKRSGSQVPRFKPQKRSAYVVRGSSSHSFPELIWATSVRDTSYNTRLFAKKIKKITPLSGLCLPPSNAPRLRKGHAIRSNRHSSKNAHQHNKKYICTNAHKPSQLHTGNKKTHTNISTNNRNARTHVSRITPKFLGTRRLPVIYQYQVCMS